MLLARTVWRVKGALILLEAKHIVEARTITRCYFENLYWLVGLIKEGEAFVRKIQRPGSELPWRFANSSALCSVFGS